MKVKQKERRDRKGKTKEEDENIKGINGKTIPEDTSTEHHEKVKSPIQNQKKISVKNKIQSDSDSPSDTSSLSSMDPDDLDPQEDLGSNSDKSSSHASKSSRKPSKSPPAPKRAKKRYLDSESDSSQPNTVSAEALDHGSTREKKSLKRVRILASDDENDADDIGNKENLRAGLAEESFTLHFSSSEDESKSDKEDKDTKSPAGAPGELLNKDSTDTFPATLLTQGLDSDDENDHITLRTAMKRKRTILDDDD
ncbi:unnamed protein product [Lymnaea stagnalis]|uniref:Uncharacterized protein n=1 Tax=Lymnaea stagnalis TaxID=6523 RepID=A0AAV2H7Z0_LYMST